MRNQILDIPPAKTVFFLSKTSILTLVFILMAGTFGNAATTEAVSTPIPASAASPESELPADDDQIYLVVEEMPEIIGGLEELYRHLSYPSRALRENIEGRVVIQFVIDTRGNVNDPIILRDIGGGCGEAAVDAIQKVRFTPGKNGGVAVPVRYSLPITYRME